MPKKKNAVSAAKKRIARTLKVGEVAFDVIEGRGNAGNQWRGFELRKSWNDAAGNERSGRTFFKHDIPDLHKAADLVASLLDDGDVQASHPDAESSAPPCADPQVDDLQNCLEGTVENQCDVSHESEVAAPPSSDNPLPD